MSNNEMESQEQDVFERTYDEDGTLILSVNEDMSLLTAAELEAINYTAVEKDKWVMVKAPSGLRPFVRAVSRKAINEMGLLGDLSEIYKAVHDPEFEPKLAKIGKPAHGKATYTLMGSKQPHYGAGTLSLSALSRKAEKWGGTEFIGRVTDVGNRVLKQVLPGYGDPGLTQRWFARGSFTPGSENNTTWSTIQLNFSDQLEEFSSSLGKFSGVHPDMHDDPASLSLWMNVSYLDGDYFGGRFNLTGCRITCETESHEMFLFSARYFHGSTGIGPYTVPAGSPLRIPPNLIPLVQLPPGTKRRRIGIVLYPNLAYLEPWFVWINAEFYRSIARKVFTTIASHHEWMMRLYIVHEPEIRARLAMANWRRFMEHLVQAGVDQESPNENDGMLHQDDQTAGLPLSAEQDQAESEPDSAEGMEKQRGTGPFLLVKAAGTNKMVLREKQAELDAKEARRVARQAGEKHKVAKVDVKVKSDAIQRDGNPDHYVNLFAWVDPSTGQDCYPRRDIAVRVLQELATENVKLKDNKKDTDYLYCGTTFSHAKAAAKKKREQAEDDGDEEPVEEDMRKLGKVNVTHKDFVHSFDPATDIIPGNSSWRPGM